MGRKKDDMTPKPIAQSIVQAPMEEVMHQS